MNIELDVPGLEFPRAVHLLSLDKELLPLNMHTLCFAKLLFYRRQCHYEVNTPKEVDLLNSFLCDK